MANDTTKNGPSWTPGTGGKTPSGQVDLAAKAAKSPLPVNRSTNTATTKTLPTS